MQGEHSDKRMVEVLSGLFDAEYSVQGVSDALDVICQLYRFDRVRSYVRMLHSDHFLVYDECRLGQRAIAHKHDNQIDFDKAYYHKNNESHKEMFAVLERDRFLYSIRPADYYEPLQELGIDFDCEIGELFLMPAIGSRTNGIAGLMVFERVLGSAYLDESELLEMKRLCELISMVVDNFEMSKQLDKEAEHSESDDLTGLLMMPMFQAQANKMRTDGSQYAMVYIDIDKFKYINDIWSYTTGNLILMETAQILLDNMRNIGVCGRLGDDKFACMMRVQNRAELVQKLELMNAQLHEMQMQLFPDIKITYIAGGYVFEEEVSVIAALDKANIARATIKGVYENTFAIYDGSLEFLVDHEKQLEKRVVAALEQKEFVPYLQPRFKLLTNEIYGAEVLARWKTEGHILAPAEFIPTFEKNGFITLMDFEIYEQTFKALHKWLQQGYKISEISLNVARIHVNEEGFLSKFMGILSKYDIPPQMIELELTEGIFAEDKDVLKSFIDGIRAQGMKVSIDDFGSAYSSLNLLKDIDVDTVKLDKAFIDNIDLDCKTGSIAMKDRVIIENVVNMINALGVKTVFEGIESSDQADFLQEVGCEYGQGYVFEKPLSLEKFESCYLM